MGARQAEGPSSFFALLLTLTLSLRGDIGRLQQAGDRQEGRPQGHAKSGASRRCSAAQLGQVIERGLGHGVSVTVSRTPACRVASPILDGQRHLYDMASTEPSPATAPLHFLYSSPIGVVALGRLCTRAGLGGAIGRQRGAGTPAREPAELVGGRGHLTTPRSKVEL
jgi:hypothetical protein